MRSIAVRTSVEAGSVHASPDFVSLRAWRAALLALSLAVAGCAGFVPQPGPGPEPAGRYVDLTTPILAIGDTQEHLATGYPLHDNDSAVDAFVEVTQRPPEQPLFGRRLAEWVLKRHPDEPFLHLGDVLDLSCRTEGQRVRDVFAATGNAGAILPGNHDGLMFGIFGYGVLEAVLDPDAAKWDRACRRGRDTDDSAMPTVNEALSKREFIAGYIAAQAGGHRPKPGLHAPPPYGEHRVSWRSPDPDAFLSAIEARVLDGRNYADSFLAQRLKLPRAPGATRDVVVIGLDTNQAGPLATSWDTLMGRSPGSVGHVRPDQVEAVSAWVDEAILDGDIVVFAGHHNWGSLGLPSRGLLRALMARVDHPLVYLSAHTHGGFWAEHRALARKPLLELNVSSLSDWPIAYRRISFAWDESARRLLVRGELWPHRGTPSASFADLLAAWEAETCGRSGVAPALIHEFDVAVVRRQRESRGTVIEWLMSAVGPECEPCEQILYEHAQAYQDAMLQTLLQSVAAVRSIGAQIPAAALPAWCGERDFVRCAGDLMASKPADYAGSVMLFRRKAALVGAVNDALDRVADPGARAYMTCRAVQAAKIDFDATDDDHNANRGEAKRRAEQFFRIEASVGVD
jgi:hypothetical protein